MVRRPRLLSALAALLLAVCMVEVSAQPPSAYAVKAAFVFNVANFVEWPASAFASPTAPIKVTVVSAQPIPDFAAALAGKSVRGRSLTVDTVDQADRLGPTHIVFIAADAASELRAALKSVGGTPVLTVAEQAIDTPSDAVLAVGVSQTRLAFAVNLDSADAASLKISPNLLKLAKGVRSARARTK